MRKFIPFMMILMTAGTANAGGLVTKHASSVQLTVDAARSTAVRVGNSYSMSGSGIDTMSGTDADVISTGSISSGIYAPGTIEVTQQTAGNSFSFSTSFTEGDAIPTSAATTGAIPNFGNVTSYTAGTAGSLAGTVGTTGAITVTAGGAGTSATGQFVSEITVID